MMLTRNSNSELLKLPDCGGLRESGKCVWLNVPACTGFSCPFCKNPNSLEKAHERLRSLDAKTQQNISEKYYSGTRPWLDIS